MGAVHVFGKRVVRAELSLEKSSISEENRGAGRLYPEIFYWIIEAQEQYGIGNRQIEE